MKLKLSKLIKTITAFLILLLAGCSAATFKVEDGNPSTMATLRNSEVTTCHGMFNGVVEFAKIDDISLQEVHGFTPAGKSSYQVSAGERKLMIGLHCVPPNSNEVHHAYAVVTANLEAGEIYQIKESHQSLTALLWIVNSKGVQVTDKKKAVLNIGWQGVHFDLPSMK